MTSRNDITASAAARLEAFASRVADNPVVVGFDGFVDSIISVVDQRHSLDAYDAIPTIDRLGAKINAAAGQSSNYELVVKTEKLGGNGPIMAHALASFNLPTSYIGALGYPSLHPVFEPLADRAECLSFCNPGLTDALEFDDGKIMLGKHASLRDISAERMDAVIGEDRMRQVIGAGRLLGMVNWTMLTRMESIWDYLMDRILPGLPEPAGGRRLIFIDLADPEKRTREDLLGGLEGCSRFQALADTVLGYNLKEAVQVAETLGLSVPTDPEAGIEALAVAIRDRLNVTGVVVHPRSGAAAAIETDAGVESGSFAGPLVRQPKLSTGAGDNFNAGFCLGLMAGAPVVEALCIGTAASGFYVRQADSASLADLTAFCRELPEPEAAVV